jgi:hypothetical protein
VAVAAAYGWPADLSENDALARMLALNLQRAVQLPSDAEVEVESESVS